MAAGIIAPSLKAKVPLFKKGLTLDTNNYRPISMLPIVSKVFEKISCLQPTIPLFK